MNIKNLILSIRRENQETMNAAEDAIEESESQGNISSAHEDWYYYSAQNCVLDKLLLEIETNKTEGMRLDS